MRHSPAVSAAGRAAPRRVPRDTSRDPDRETRGRLLDEARKLFSARGFRRVTVREICRAANANVAAVNYHFRDKRGLYREVLDAAMAVMQETTEQARAAGGGSAEQRFESFIRIFLQRIGQAKDPWIHQLMAHEMADPTDALDLVVSEVVAPRIAYMRELVAQILGVPPDDRRVLPCVLSVQAQLHAAMNNPVSTRLVPGLTRDPVSLDRMAQHIVEFSLGGVTSLRPR